MFEKQDYNTICIQSVGEDIIALGGSPKIVNRKVKAVNNEWELDDQKSDLLRAHDLKYLMKLFMPKKAFWMKPAANKTAVLGAVYGDVVGSRFEGRRVDEQVAHQAVASGIGLQNGHLTDDSILTMATLDAVKEYKKYPGRYTLNNDLSDEAVFSHTTISGSLVDLFAKHYKKAGQKNPDAGYGGAFRRWLQSKDMKPYGSRGNGSAMRVSPIGCAGLGAKETLRLAIASAVCTHDNFDGVRGAVVETMCIWMACCGCGKEEIFQYMKDVYSGPGLNLFENFSIEDAKEMVQCWVECPFSVPAAIISVHEADSFEKAIENALCVGFDTDTNAAIAGAVAGVLFGIDDETKEKVKEKISNWRKT